MSSSIKPPTSSSPGIAGVDGARDADAVAPSRSSGAQASRPSQGAERATGPTEAWIARLEAGEVTREQAIEGLVAEALEAHGGARLSGPHRAQLEEVLRSALMNDPLLSRLLSSGVA